MSLNPSVFILTLNEEDNLARTLDALTWAAHVLVLDSGSSDDTLKIAADYDNVQVSHRPFDSHAEQANAALAATRSEDEWVLALDADYVVTEQLRACIETLQPPPHVNGYRIPVRFCVHGHPLRGSLYPAVIALYRRNHARYVQDGHAHRVVIDGAVETLSAPMLHDDRKSLRRWLHTQHHYMKLEVDMLYNTPFHALRLSGKVRRAVVVAPFAAVLWCLFVKGLALDGWPGLHYTLQRMIAECLLSLEIVTRRIRRETTTRVP